MQNVIGLPPEDLQDIVHQIAYSSVSKSSPSLVTLTLPWMLSAQPLLLLGALFVSWCIAFVLVIDLYPDNTTS